MTLLSYLTAEPIIQEIRQIENQHTELSKITSDNFQVIFADRPGNRIEFGYNVNIQKSALVDAAKKALLDRKDELMEQLKAID